MIPGDVAISSHLFREWDADRYRRVANGTEKAASSPVFREKCTTFGAGISYMTAIFAVGMGSGPDSKKATIASISVFS